MTRAIREIFLGLTGLALSCAPVLVSAQESAAMTLEQQASAAVAESDWPLAYRLYSELSKQEEANAATWFQLGLATLNSGKPTADAIGAFEKARELGFAPGPALYGIARAQALQSNQAATLQTLTELADLGPSRGVVSRLESESAFDALRADTRFVELLTRLTPCSSAQYRQFDFWIGSWNVVSPTGQVLGSNTISVELDGCLLTERWESTGGSKGLSINYYDSETGKWTQTYRDNTGNISQWPDLIGGLRDGAMVLEGSTDPQNLSRWTWTKVSVDRVRQMAENSADGGKTWQVVWDSFYDRSSQ